MAEYWTDFDNLDDNCNNSPWEISERIFSLNPTPLVLLFNKKVYLQRNVSIMLSDT